LDSRELCYSILYDCFENEAFLNLALSGPGIDDFTRAAVYGTVTYVFTEDYMIKKVSGKNPCDMDPEVRTILRLGVWQLLFSDKVPDYAAVNSSVELCKIHKRKAASFVNAVLRKISGLPAEEKVPANFKSPEARYSVKSEIFGILKKDYGMTRAGAIAEALLKPLPLSVRVNTLKTDTISLENELTGCGFNVERSGIVDNCLILKPGPDAPSIDSCDAFKEGKFMVQGQAAQMASVMADPKPGMRILDCCAAPGGKTTHLAQLAENKAFITALDVNESRTRLIKQNVERLGAENVEIKVADASSYEDKDLFDIVLCDAPCSGLGIMGGKPDIRLTISYERILEIIQKQILILSNISKLVRPGGRLVYSTCTINSGENEGQVRDFLNANTQYNPENMVTFLPDTDGCEGFFVSVMRRLE